MAIKFLNSVNADSGVLYVDAANDRVGIGTTSPGARLNVKSTDSTADQITLTHSGNTVNVVAIGQESSHGSLILRANSGVNKVRLSAAGNNSYILDSNVGIGTTSPNQKLHLYGGNISIDNSSDVALIFSKSGSSKYEWYLDNAANNFGLYDRGNSAWRFNVTNSGNVGIGNTSPAVKLAVAGTIQSSAGGSWASSAGYTQLTHDGSTTGYLSMYYDTETLVMGAGISQKNNITISGHSADNTIYFRVGNAERMRITNSGNVGIGTTAPNALLSISKTISSDTRFLEINNAGNNQFRSDIDFTVTSGGITVGRISSIYPAGNNVGLSFSTYGTSPSTGLHERMRINGSNGKVGIGTTDPGLLLEVNSNSTSAEMIRARYNASYYTDYGSNNMNFTGPSQTYQFRNNGSAAITINSSSNVGIGTTSPATRLDVVDAIPIITLRSNNDSYASLSYYSNNLQKGLITYHAANNALQLSHKEAGTTSNDPHLVIKDGNVGIGTASPISKLHLYASASGATAYQSGNDGLTIERGGRVAINLLSPTASDSYVFFGNPTAGNAAYLGYQNTENRLVLKSSDYISLLDSTGEVVRVDGGNVGIGTTSPVGKLDIDNGAVTDVRIRGNQTTNARIGAYNFYNTAASDTVAAISADRDGANDAGALAFDTQVAGGGMTERMRITSTGNVGIGTTSPYSNVTLQYTGNNSAGTYYGNLVLNATTDSTWNRLRFDRGGVARFGVALSYQDKFVISNLYTNGTTADPDDTAFVILQNSNVGIGTTSPEGKLDVVADDGSTTSAVKTLVLGGGTDTTGNGQYIQFRSSSNVTLGSQISGSRTGAGAASDLRFSTTGSDSVVREALRITAAGNIGIGTTSPQTELHVKGNNGWGEVRVEGQTFASGHGSSLEFYSEGTALADIYASTDKHLYFRTNGTTERMRITAAGNVGIGTTSPSAKLDVIGVGRILMPDDPLTGAVTAKILSYSIAPYGMVFRSYSSGANSIQVQRESSDSETFALSLQPNGGNVGIGTTSPGSVLQVKDSQDSSFDSGIGITRSNSSQTGYINMVGGAMNINAPSGLPIKIRDGGTTNVTISGDGNVGIGESQPAYKLHVAGTFRASGNSSIGGNLGIGTTSPSEKLHVVGDTRIEGNLTVNGTYTQIDTDTNTTEQWNVTNDGTGPAVTINQTGAQDIMDVQDDGTSVFYIEDGGNVGIGTTDPSEKLHVSGSTRINGTIYSGDGSISANNSLQLVYNATSGIGTIAAKSTGGNTTLALQTADSGTTTDRLYIASNGNVGIGTTSPSSMLSIANKFIFNNDGVGSWGGAADYGRLTWDTGKAILTGLSGKALSFGSDASYDRMYLDTNGNVGIGTTSPAEKLHVNSGNIRLKSSSDGSNGILALYDSSNTESGQIYPHSGDLRIYSSNDVLFNNTGNVGIGTTSPSEKLEVNGNVIADGYLGREETTTADTGSDYASYDVVTSQTGPGLYEVVIKANPNSAGSSAYADYLYGKVIIGTGWSGSVVTNYIHYVQENPDPRSIYDSGGGNMTVEAFFVVNNTESSSVANGTSYSVRIKISGYTVAGSGTVVRTKKLH